MKRRTLLFFIIPILIGVIIFVGCNKKIETSSKEPAIPEIQNQRDLKLTRMFEEFKKNGRQHLKEEEKMCPDSAIWYIKGTSNFTYGCASRETAITVVDSTFISLFVNEQKITTSEVWDKYCDMIDTIRARYQKLEGEENQLISVELEKRALFESELRCKATFIFAKRGFPPDYCTFNQVDSWVWWDGSIGAGGTCNTTPPQHPELDAAMLITQKIMNCKGVPSGNYYWEPIEDVDLYPLNFPYNESPGPYNYYHYLMFWNDSDSSYFHGCLSPEECEFYRIGTKWVVNTSKNYGGARPDNLSLISTEIHGSAHWLANSSIYFHYGIAHYGILHWSLNPPTPLD